MISIDNVINVSVNDAGVGVGEYNTSNLAFFTTEQAGVDFGSLGYKIYIEPQSVAEDFGTSSLVYQAALSVFSQQPNILAANGYFVVILRDVTSQLIEFDEVPDGGAFTLEYGSDVTSSLPFGATAATVQAALRLLEGLEKVVVTGNFTSGFTVQFFGVAGDATLLAEGANTLVDGVTPVVITIAETEQAETLPEAVTRTNSLIEYFGLAADSQLTQVELLALGAVITPLRKIAFMVSSTVADLNALGKFDNVRLAGYDQVRCIYYNHPDINPLLVPAAYAGAGLSVNFEGVNTTKTMHLKQLIGILADPTVGETQVQLAKACGADLYPSSRGRAGLFTSGANEFFDNVYNLLWLVGALQIAGFNLLAQTGTKIPQTEQGMIQLKSPYREVLERALANGFISGGRWTSPTTFGVQADFLDNIAQRGYYIFSQPISLQSPAQREERIAPLVQIAIKYAGAIHKSNVVVNINR